MPNLSTLALCLAALLLSLLLPPHFLTRRLAADLIAASDTFAAPQQFQLHTGIISNRTISRRNLSCSSIVAGYRPPKPLVSCSCPAALLGYHAHPFRRGYFSKSHRPRRRRETILQHPRRPPRTRRHHRHRQTSQPCDVEFTWRWIPMNEVGAALYSADLHYQSTASFAAMTTAGVWSIASPIPPNPSTNHSGTPSLRTEKLRMPPFVVLRVLSGSLVFIPQATSPHVCNRRRIVVINNFPPRAPMKISQHLLWSIFVLASASLAFADGKPNSPSTNLQLRELP